VPDRRVRKTRQQLRDALVTLILERGWDAVSVQDVCQKADIGRSTFYVHFADKEDLLLSGFDQLHELLESQRRQSAEPFGFAEGMLAHAAESEKLFRAVVGRQSGQQVQWRVRDLLTSLVDAELAAARLSKPLRQLLTRFIAGGFFQLLIGWIEQPGALTAEQLAATFRNFALAAATAAGVRLASAGRRPTGPEPARAKRKLSRTPQ
jgi:AcrR family transcriptional regulator